MLPQTARERGVHDMRRPPLMSLVPAPRDVPCTRLIQMIQRQRRYLRSYWPPCRRSGRCTNRQPSAELRCRWRTPRERTCGGKGLRWLSWLGTDSLPAHELPSERRAGIEEVDALPIVERPAKIGVHHVGGDMEPIGG